MIGLVMAGGRGSRMKMLQEKLLLGHKKPVVLGVLDAMYDSRCFTSVFAVTSPNSPQTRKLLVEMNHRIIDTPGSSYSEDLRRVLQWAGQPVFVTSADLPLLDGAVIASITEQYDPDVLWTSVLVTEKFLDSLGLSPGTCVEHEGVRCAYTGISLVNAQHIGDGEVAESFLVLDDRRVAFNMNTRNDYELLDFS